MLLIAIESEPDSCQQCWDIESDSKGKITVSTLLHFLLLCQQRQEIHKV